TSDGIYLDEIESPVYEMPATSWSSHIQEQYKSLSNEMLSQSEFENEIRGVYWFKDFFDLSNIKFN
ncbi:TPA: hypothetical protein NJW64_003813, partial [Acinetobacter baumannii]|nr:hypothetical protein [Acinetobacter baumannii]